MAKRKREAKPPKLNRDAKPRGFVARPCSKCEAFRPKNKNYSHVRTTIGNVRYCRCRYCGHTWAQTVSAEFFATIANAPPQSVETSGSPAKIGNHGSRSISTVDAS